MPGDDEHRGDREDDHEGRPEIRLGEDQQNGSADDEQQRFRQVLHVHHALRAIGQQGRRVEDKRQLHELGGLELELAGTDPSFRAVDRHADVRHVGGRHEHEGDGQQRSCDQVDFGDSVAGQEAHRHETDAAVDDIADQIAAAVAAALQQRRRRRGAVDHHRTEGQQAHGGGDEHAMLERLRPRGDPFRLLSPCPSRPWPVARLGSRTACSD